MTLTRRIIPCLDISNGRVVKGINFEDIKDVGDPVELAKKYSDNGADELVFLDITASEEKRATTINLVSDIAQVIDIPFTVGGGVNTLQHARDILLAGADKVGINTGAIKNHKIIAELMNLFGRQCVVVAIDAKKNITDDKTWYQVYIYGGKKETGVEAIQWAKDVQGYGAGEILLTSIDMDGTKNGYDIELTKKIVDAVNIPVIASGGCGKPDDIVDLFMKTSVDAALAASIFHYDSFAIPNVKKKLKDNNISVRM